MPPTGEIAASSPSFLLMLRPHSGWDPLIHEGCVWDVTAACAMVPASLCLLRGQNRVPLGLPQTKPGLVLGLPPLHPTPDMLPPSCLLSPFLPFPDFRASHVLPALLSRASVSHPPIDFSISLPLLLSPLCLTQGHRQSPEFAKANSSRRRRRRAAEAGAGKGQSPAADLALLLWGGEVPFAF